MQRLSDNLFVCGVCVCAAIDGEGVVYALSEAAANEEMCTSCGGEGDDLVLLNEQEEPTEVGTLH